MAKHGFRVGDEFEGSPIQLNHWVTPVWAAGGKVEFEGTTATIVWLPEEAEEEVVEEVAPVEEAPEIPAPVEELEPVAIEPEEVAVPVEEVAAVEAEVAVEPAVVEEEKPKPSRGRPKKISESVDEVN